MAKDVKYFCDVCQCEVESELELFRLRYFTGSIDVMGKMVQVKVDCCKPCAVAASIKIALGIELTKREVLQHE
jgi:hypothetical protein